MKVCAFTGHRNLYSYDFDEHLLERVVLNLVKNGVTRFLCGMAIGFDLKCAQVVLALKEKYDIELVACLPCPNQSEKYTLKDKTTHDEILLRSDEIVIIEDEYKTGCMFKRDRYLVDNSDTIVCFLRRRSGGTYYTVNYARKANKKIIEL